ARADHAHANAVAVERGEVAADEEAEQPEDEIDLRRRTRPVLGGKAEQRQVADAEVERGAHRPAHRLDAAAMALAPRQAARRRPAAVAVHDDRNVARNPRTEIAGFGVDSAFVGN